MSTLPQLQLEQDPSDPTHISLSFNPDPKDWVFDDARGTRAQLKTEIQRVVDSWQAQQAPDAAFDTTAAQGLRGAVLYCLLQWITFRGLRFAVVP